MDLEKHWCTTFNNGDKFAIATMVNVHRCVPHYLYGPLHLHGPFYLHRALSFLCGFFTPILGLSLQYWAHFPPWGPPSLGVVCASSVNCKLHLSSFSRSLCRQKLIVNVTTWQSSSSVNFSIGQKFTSSFNYANVIPPAWSWYVFRCYRSVLFGVGLTWWRHCMVQKFDWVARNAIWPTNNSVFAIWSMQN